VASVPTRTVRLHGHDVCFQDTGGDGPVVVLLHGIACSSTTWAPVLPMLAGRVRAIVPDLLGHGQSAKPRGDYSLGSHASGLRDLLSLLGHDRVTVVGHSLGGGIAMQFAYQFPERCERLVLVSSGGLGREVSPWLRAATLPGSELVLPVIAHQRVQRAAASVARLLERIRLRPSESAQQIALSYASLADAETRAAFIATARTVIDPRGQRVSAMDRLYLSAAMPTMLVWGGRDRIIPVAHAAAAHTEMPGSRLEIFENARHFPHADEPARFARVLLEFVESTTPAVVDVRTLRDELLARS
jgi:pimeloyl-ACP methyl ester carboxylesterase